MTRDGQWTLVPTGGWVGGHWTGLIWLAYAHTQDPALLAAARAWTERLAPRQFDLGTHDLGFLFQLSYLLGSQLTGDAALKPAVIQASRSLIRRFNRERPVHPGLGRAGCFARTTRARDHGYHDEPDLLFWASQETGDPHLPRSPPPTPTPC